MRDVRIINAGKAWITHLFLAMSKIELWDYGFMAVKGWLFLFSNPNTCYFLLLVTLGEMEWRKGETSEAIQIQLYYNGSLQLSLEGKRPPPSNKIATVTERTLYFCLACKLIWPLWSSHIFTQWGWLILFSPDHFPGQHKNGESSLNYLFLRTFRKGWMYFLSAPFIAAES